MDLELFSFQVHVVACMQAFMQHPLQCRVVQHPGLHIPAACSVVALQMYYAEQKPSFKPGWKTKRPQEAIQHDAVRREQEVAKARDL